MEVETSEGYKINDPIPTIREELRKFFMRKFFILILEFEFFFSTENQSIIIILIYDFLGCLFITICLFKACVFHVGAKLFKLQSFEWESMWVSGKPKKTNREEEEIMQPKPACTLTRILLSAPYNNWAPLL